MKRTTLIRLGIGCAALALIGAACSTNKTEATPAAAPTAGDPTTKAATLRVDLNSLLKEHVTLAAGATDAALSGRPKAFEAAAAALDANSVELSNAIGSVYGTGAGDAFLPLWRKHIGFFVDYTTGVAAKDKAKQARAVADLQQYTKDFGAFLSSASPALTKDAVAGLVLDHVLGLKGVVDAQAAKDYTKAYTQLRTATAHMQMIADALASTITKQFADKFSG